MHSIIEELRPNSLASEIAVYFRRAFPIDLKNIKWRHFAPRTSDIILLQIKVPLQCVAVCCMCCSVSQCTMPQRNKVPIFQFTDIHTQTHNTHIDKSTRVRSFFRCLFAWERAIEKSDAVKRLSRYINGIQVENESCLTKTRLMSHVKLTISAAHFCRLLRGLMHMRHATFKPSQRKKERKKERKHDNHIILRDHTHTVKPPSLWCRCCRNHSEEGVGCRQPTEWTVK